MPGSSQLIRLDVTLFILLLISVAGNIFAASHYLGRQSAIADFETQIAADSATLSTHSERSPRATFRSMARSLSPEGRTVLGEVFRPQVEDLQELRGDIREKRQLVEKLLKDPEMFSEEAFRAAATESRNARTALQDQLHEAFIEAMIAMPSGDRQAFAGEFRKIADSVSGGAGRSRPNGR